MTSKPKKQLLGIVLISILFALAFCIMAMFYYNQAMTYKHLLDETLNVTIECKNGFQNCVNTLQKCVKVLA